MKIMVTSFRRSHAGTAALSVSDPAVGHRQPMPLPKIPGHSRASLGQSLMGSLLLSPGFWCSDRERSMSRSPCLFNLYASISFELPVWMKHKLESRFPGEISITSDMQMTRLMEESKELKSLFKVKEEKEKVGLKLSIQKTKIMVSSPITS